MAKTRRNQPPKRSNERVSQKESTAASQTTANVGPAVGSAANRPVSAAVPSANRTGSAARSAAATPPATSDPRAAERIERQRQRATLRQQQEQFKRLRAIALSVAAVLIVGFGLIWLLNQPTKTLPASVRTIPIASFEHIPDGQKGTDFNSVPPTSGQHYSNPANAGIHTQPIPDEVQIHNLEHGQIMIQYTCTDCPELVEQLKVFYQRYPKWVLVAPYPDPDKKVGARIALTAWGKIDTFDEFDEQRITAFIEALKNKGRENVIME